MTMFGESTPQHINLISGNTHGAVCVEFQNGKETGKEFNNCSVEKNIGPGKTRTIPAVVDGTMLSNVDPEYDICSEAKHAGSTSTSTATGNATGPKIAYKIEMKGPNIGDRLNEKHISWGWFSAGFKLPTTGGCEGRERTRNRIQIKRLLYRRCPIPILCSDSQQRSQTSFCKD